MAELPAIIVGLGNPGTEHARDRHNVGYWLVDDLAGGSPFRSEPKILGEACRIQLAAHAVRLVKPTTFMNRSGQAMRRALDYYKLPPERVLVIHDDLDLPPGTARLKSGGGHGGHNGLRNIISHCGPDFLRLRIGIGHPGRREAVVHYVLRPPLAGELADILDALHAGCRALDILFADGLDRAMTYLHTVTPRDDATVDLGPAG